MTISKLSDVSIRRATVEDEQNVTTLLEESYGQLMKDVYPAPLLSSLLPFITRANPVLLSSGRFYVAVTKDERIVSCGGWSEESPSVGDASTSQQSERIAHVRHFGTHPDWVRNGLGSEIFTLCEKESRSCGLNHFHCFSSLNGESFYSSLGFFRIEEKDLHMLGDLIFPVIFMAKNYPPTS